MLTRGFKKNDGSHSSTQMFHGDLRSGAVLRVLPSSLPPPHQPPPDGTGRRGLVGPLAAKMEGLVSGSVPPFLTTPRYPPTVGTEDAGVWAVSGSGEERGTELPPPPPPPALPGPHPQLAKTKQIIYDGLDFMTALQTMSGPPPEKEKLAP